PPHRKSVHHFGGEHRDNGRLEKSVAGSERKHSVSQAQGQSCGEDQHIKMTGMMATTTNGAASGRCSRPVTSTRSLILSTARTHHHHRFRATSPTKPL